MTYTIKANSWSEIRAKLRAFPPSATVSHYFRRGSDAYIVLEVK